MANGLRGEVALSILAGDYRLRPSFERLIAAEAETGSLIGLLDRASAGDIRLGEMSALLWHCLDAGRPDRTVFEQALLETGISAFLPAYRAVLLSIFKGC